MSRWSRPEGHSSGPHATGDTPKPCGRNPNERNGVAAAVTTSQARQRTACRPVSNSSNPGHQAYTAEVASRRPEIRPMTDCAQETSKQGLTPPVARTHPAAARQGGEDACRGKGASSSCRSSAPGEARGGGVQKRRDAHFRQTLPLTPLRPSHPAAIAPLKSDPCIQ